MDKIPFGISPQGDTRNKNFWEGPYPKEQIGLTFKPLLRAPKTPDDYDRQQDIERHNEMVAKVLAVARALKEDGREFELTDNNNEFLLRVKGFNDIMHVTKVDDPHVDIPSIIYNKILHPES